MTTHRKFMQALLSFIIILSMTLPLMRIHPAAAQGEDGIRRRVNSQSGKVNFIGPESGKSVSSRELGFAAGVQAPSPSLAARQLAERFAPEFGVENPQRDLTEMRTHKQDNGRVTVRYQQEYQGIPVIGGELIVNTDENGDLYSMNGEVAQDLALDTQPAISVESAIETAKQGMLKWYGGTEADYQASEPTLWIFDEQLLRPSSRPVELVWRLELTSAQQPIRELVLVSAKTGNISLHFNQIDTARKRTEREKDAFSANTSAVAQAAITWYVSPTGGNACNASDPHCTTIQAAIDSSTASDTIRVEKGPYSENLTVSKNLILTGGWNSAFTTQDGQTVIDGQTLGRSVTISSDVTAAMERFDITRGKVADSDGGGILNSGALTFINGAVYNNSAHYLPSDDPITDEVISDGGGIYSDGTQLTLTNVTISNNEADTGGGLFIQSGDAALNNVTITQNIAANRDVVASGGGIQNTSASVTISNSIIAGNAAEDGQDCYGELTSGGNNLIGYNLGCSMTPAAGDQIGTQFEPLDAMLGDLGDNGSSTQTHALLTGSPAIDAGSSATCATTDQRGVTRPAGACDMGAFEGSEAQTATANIKIYAAKDSILWPGDLIICDSPPGCTGGSDPTADQAYQLALGIYNFYLTTHGRKGIDNNNMPIVSTVHYCPPGDCPYLNAFWSGSQMIYGDGFVNADDVAAHELTHGVTQYESHLLYFYQSGAIDESFADLWGEYYDQTNGLGTDTPLVKWEIGEDATGYGAMRSMSDPTAYGDPDKMTSPLYNKQSYQDDHWDDGGVHSNSGVNNKAVYLMVDGGTFNGKTVTALGWVKTGDIYYEAQTNLLTSGSDYSDLYYALQQACTNVTGQSSGITSADCAQVRNALDAVEMNSQPVTNFNPDVSLCPTGMTTDLSDPSMSLFEDSFESGTTNWTSTSTQGPPNAWNQDNYYAADGLYTMWGNDGDMRNDSYLTTVNNITLPAGSIPFLFFKHAFVFEYNADSYYDGGVLEYSTNGTTWLDAQALFSAGQNYSHTISSSYSNILAGRPAFTGDSHGYVSSRYDLRSLAGQAVKFRWRFATDRRNLYDSEGWYVDDVKIYHCSNTPAIPALQTPANNALVTSYTPTLNWADATPALDHYQLQISTDSNFVNLAYNESDLPTSQFTANLQAGTKYYWRVQAFNAIDQSLGWSAARYFRTLLAQPGLLEPTSGNVPNKRPELKWNAVDYATGYKIQIAKVSNFSTILVKGTSKTSAFTPISDLRPNTLYYWRVQATGPNGPSAWSDNGSFVTGNPPGIPALLAPANNVLVNILQPKLDWKDATAPASTAVHHYQVQIAKDATFQDIVLDQDTPDPAPKPVSALVPPPLTTNQKYYWRVRTYSNTDQHSAWSAVRSFRVAMPKPILVEHPSVPNKRPTLEWGDVTGATGYKIQIAKVANFGTVLVKGTSKTSAFTPSVDLLSNTTYYWRVQATGPNGPSAWSDNGSFLTGNPPGIPALLAPANNALVNTLSPRLDWKDVTTADHYQVQVAKDAAFQEIVLDTPATTSDLTPTLGLHPKYYWRVKSYNSANEYSAWSAVRYFRVTMPPPVLVSPINGTTIHRLKPIFDWADATGATGYTIQVSTAPTFGTLLINTSTTLSVYISPKNLPLEKTLYWRVKANGPTGSTLWTTSTFIID